MQDIAKSILQVAQAEGTAQKTVNLNLNGNLEVDSVSNTIIYAIETSHSTYPNTETLINDWLSAPQPGAFGTNNPGVISVKSENLDAQKSKILYRLTYRELVNPSTHEGVKILLLTPRNNLASAGQHSMSISKKGVAVERGMSNLKGDLAKISVEITIS